MNPHELHEAPDVFPAAPDYLDAETGGEQHVPPLAVVHDGPLPTVPYPARTFTTSQVQTPSDGSPVELAPHNVARRSLLLINTAAAGGATVYIAPGRASATSSHGFPLPPGAAITLNTSHAVYGVTANGTTATVAALAEQEDGR